MSNPEGVNNMNDNKQLKHRFIVTAISCIVFIGICAGAFFLLTGLMRQKWSYKDNAAQYIVESYYDEPEDSIDVLALGASTLRNGISSLEMYNEYGFTTYSRATSIQLPVISYYLLKETLQTHDLKAVVLDATIFTNLVFEDSKSLGGKVHEAIDYMPMSDIKRDLINEVVQQVEGLSATDFYVPLYAYHDRWSELSEDDFTINKWNSYYYKGQYPNLRISSTSYPVNYMNESEEADDGSMYMEDLSAGYLDQIKDLCDANGIKLLLIKTPTSSWTTYRHSIVKNYADEHGVDFLDFNELSIQEEIGYAVNTDYCDTGRHPNISGAQKISLYLGKYLKQICDLPDHRSDSKYSDWNDCYNKYNSLIEDWLLKRETNFVTFLSKLNKENYTVLISTRNDTSKYYTSDVDDALKNLGINAPFGSVNCLSYVALIDSGQLVYQEWKDGSTITDDEDAASTLTYETKYNEHDILITSYANQLAGNTAYMSFDGTAVSPQAKGFNIVVYDKETDLIVIQKAYNTGRDGKEYYRESEFVAYHDDPAEYIRHLTDSDDYISVIAVSGDSRMYLPGTVTEAMKEIGLEPIAEGFNKPYVAILNGSEVLFNKVGTKKRSAIVTELNIDEFHVVVNSDSSASTKCSNIIIDEVEVTNKSSGMTILVYNKTADRKEDTKHFVWSRNYTVPIRLSNMTELSYICSIVDEYNYDMSVMYYGGDDYEINESVLSELYEMGFTGIEDHTSYIGVKSDGRIIYQNGAAEGQELSFTMQYEDRTITTSIIEKQAKWSENNTDYTNNYSGFYIVVYDPVTDAVLLASRWK